jgi:hypothetical protein
MVQGNRKDNNEVVVGWLWQKKYQTRKYLIRTFPDMDDNYEDFVVDIDTVKKPETDPTDVLVKQLKDSENQRKYLADRVESLKKTVRARNSQNMDIAVERTGLVIELRAYKESLDYGASVTIGSLEAQIKELKKDAEINKMIKIINNHITDIDSLTINKEELHDNTIGWCVSFSEGMGGPQFFNSKLHDALKEAIEYIRQE